MPLPKPKKNENQEDFIKRCMHFMKSEEDGKRWPDNKQRFAICIQQYEKYKSGKKSSVTEMIEKYLNGGF